MASVEEEVVRHLTLYKQGGSEGAGEHLKALQALLLQDSGDQSQVSNRQSQEGLLRTFLPEILELQNAPIVATRKWLAEFLEAAALAVPSLLASILPCLQALLSDAQSGVVKRTLQAGRLLMLEVVHQLLQDVTPASETASQSARLWEVARAFKETAATTALQHANTGVRLYGVKFVEALILLYTPQAESTRATMNGSALFTVHAGLVSPGHPLLDPSQLAVEATGHLASLLQMIRGPTAAGLPTPVMLVLISSLTSIATQRMSFFGRILPALLSLSQPPANPSSSEIGGDVKPRIHPPSVLHALKVAYVTLVKLQDASVAPWRPRLISSLRSIGANDAANAEERRIDRQAPQQGAVSSRKRGAEKVRPVETIGGSGSGVDGAEGGAKRVKIEGGEGERPKSMPAVEPGAVAVKRATGGGPSLDTMLGLVCQLAARMEPEAQAQLRQLVEQMPIGILVDLVMASMKNDPRPQPDIKREGSQADLQANVKPPKHEAPFSHPPGFPPQVKHEILPPPPPLPNLPQDSYPRPLSQAPPPPVPARDTAPGALVRTSTPPVATGGQVTGVGDGRWAVVPLSAVQRVEQARGAITRVVKAGQLVRGTRAGRLRAALVGRMLAQAEEAADKDRVEEIVSQLFSDAARNDALEVALQWLYCVYALFQLEQMEADVTHDDADVMRPDDRYGADVMKPDDADVTQRNGADVMQEDGADVMQQDGADVMQEDGAGAMQQDHADVKIDAADAMELNDADVIGVSEPRDNALAVVEDEQEAPETYRSLLLSLARAAASRLPPSDRTFQRLLCDAPALPPSVLALLHSMLQPPDPEAEEADAAARAEGAAATATAGYLERVTQSLSALWALILQRPLLRGRCLDMALRCTYEHPDEEVRNKAIRLVANKLYPLPYCRAAIQAVAREQLEEATQEETVTEPAASAPEDENNPEEGHARLERTESGREAGTSMEAAKQKMSLFFGLCYKSPELLPLLVARYGTAGKGAKQAILRQVPLLLKSVGPSSPPVLAILEDPPAGVEPLLLQILNVLTESAPPSEELTQRVKWLYETKLKDARLLIPILSFMKKDEARSVFPALLTLPLPQFKLALNRLLQGSAATGPALTPTEVLVALHEVDPKKDGVPLKKVTDACTACMAQRTIFTPQVLATTLNQLVERSPIPLLFMRTVLQSVGASPSLRPFVVELLARLVRREIWAMPQLWVGFLKAAHHTVPESLPVLLQLPARQVAEVVAKNPDLKPLLAAHVTQSSAKTALPKSILVVLGLEVGDDS